MLIGDRNCERRDDRQCQRHPQGHARAFAGLAVDFDDPADPLDVRADDVHSNAAAGDGRHFLGRRQACLEDQCKLVAWTELGRFVFGNDSAADRLLEQPFAVDSAAVVMDVDQNLVARLPSRDGKDADLALAGLQALGGLLNPVIDRVTDDVRQGIADHFDHFAIQLDVAAFDIDQHLLAELGRQVADHPRQADKQILDPLHARAGDCVAHLGDNRREPLECAIDRHVACGFAQAPGEFVPRQHHVGDRAHHPVEKLDRQADGARCSRRPGGGFRGCNHRSGNSFGTGSERIDQMIVVPGRHVFTRLDRRDHFADSVDDREHGADQGAIRMPPAGTDVCERILGRMAQCFEPREFEEAAIALNGVDEAKNAVEPGAVVGLRLPGDDLAAQGFEHFVAFGYEIGNQIVHRRNRPSALALKGLMPGRS